MHVFHGAHASNQAHFCVADCVTGPLLAFANRHFDFTRANHVKHKWGSVETNHLDLPVHMGGGNCWHHELRHAVIDTNDV